MGWGQAFAGTNTAAYKSLAPEATGCYLRLDDTGTNNARCVGYEFMGDIDSGQGSFPTIGQQPGGLYCPKSATADSTPRAWLLIGDARALYFCPATGGVPGNHEAYFFGDINSYKSGDAYSCVIGMPDTNAYTNSGSPAPGSIAISLRYSDDKPPYIARSHTGLGGAQGCARVGVLNISANQAYSGTNGYSGYTTDPFPNTANNGLIFCPVMCHTGGGFRGEFPGIAHVPQNCYGLFTTLDVVLGTGALAGKKALALRVGSAADGGAAAAAFFDATGPWRV